VIDGPWSEPRIYPEMAGILDNPDAAYAKLKEMGKGLFAPGGGLSSALGGLGGTGSSDSGQPNQLGKLGETLGNLLQQGFGQGGHRGRSLAPPGSPTPAEPSPPAQSDPTAEPSQDSQAMNEVLRQLFNR
jgi:AsmA protein